jgi:hypothetical protein
MHAARRMHYSTSNLACYDDELKLLRKPFMTLLRAFSALMLFCFFRGFLFQPVANLFDFLFFIRAGSFSILAPSLSAACTVHKLTRSQRRMKNNEEWWRRRGWPGHKGGRVGYVRQRRGAVYHVCVYCNGEAVVVIILLAV